MQDNTQTSRRTDVAAYVTFYYHMSANVITQVNPYSQNWDYCKMYANDFWNPTYDTFAHEFGHVLGLAENNSNPSSIMCQLVHGRVATSPSADDFEGLNHIYNGIAY